FFDHDLVGRLVRSQTVKRRMAKVPVLREGLEVNLGDELRFDPVHAFLARRVRERRSILLERTKAAIDRFERLAREAGSDLADVLERAVLSRAQKERAEVRSRSVRFGEAADHELLPAEALYLEPIPPAPAPVRRATALRNDPFEPEPARAREELGAVSDDVIAVPDAIRFREDLPKLLFARFERLAAPVFLSELQEIEHEIDELVL